VFYRDSHHVYRVPELDELPWLLHGFGTRDSDIPAQFGNLATLKQIHSAKCVPAAGRMGVLGEGDALLENTRGSVVAVKTADCIPILLVDERLRAVAAVHAGWRGTAARIVARAVETMGQRFGTRAADLHAAIGPGIGPCCYEVGPEVAAQFPGQPMAVQPMPGRTARLDLADGNARQLAEVGVTTARIHASYLCTRCRSDEFHSFRRDREASGRMHSFVGIR
jgi:polyphenol oxidase